MKYLPEKYTGGLFLIATVLAITAIILNFVVAKGIQNQIKVNREACINMIVEQDNIHQKEIVDIKKALAKRGILVEVD